MTEELPELPDLADLADLADLYVGRPFRGAN